MEYSPSEHPEFNDLYPERRGNLIEGKRPRTYRRMCEDNVWNVMQKQPLIRTLLGALKMKGCEVKVYRHIQCDYCSKDIRDRDLGGGYDNVVNQVFLCANVAKDEKKVHRELVRNLITMFDACVSKMDFKNVDHLACNEIRKANLTGSHLKITESVKNSKLAGFQKDRVRSEAIDNLVKAKFVDEELATKAVDRVFDKCYKDLEPIGRRCRNREDINNSHSERYLLGYL